MKMIIGLSALLLCSAVGRRCTMCKGQQVIGIVDVHETQDLKLVHLYCCDCPLCHGSGLQPVGRRDLREGGGER